MDKPKITVAESAGFCFGVDRAVKLLTAHVDAGKKACTLGPLIHNPDFIRTLEQKGVTVVDSPEQTPPAATLFIRTHGVPRQTEERIASLGIAVQDVTCPFVKRIHKLAAQQSAAGDVVIITGDKDHPEVQGICSYAGERAYVVGSEEELEALIASGAVDAEANVSMMSQTTFDTKTFKKCEKIVTLHFTNAKIFDTICNATALRQAEAYRLSGENDMMVVIGGRNSSNTQKLYAVCKNRCPSYLIENALELSEINFNGVRSIGVTAGASTPDSIIKEVEKTMSDILEPIGTETEAEGQAEVTETTEAAKNPEELSFEEQLEEDFNSRQTNGKKAVGIVTRISANEIEVDIGRKQTGYIPIDEYSSDPSADPTKELKVGDEINVIIMKTNDAEGTILLSKKLYDVAQYWDAIVDAYKEGTVLEGTVSEVIGKGLIIYLNGIRIFIPASHSTVPRDGRLEEMLNKTVKFKIISTENRGHRAVGSIKDASRDARREAREKFWADAAEGQKYTGTVKSLTDYGAFVELAPGVDGMIHRSELSWKRIKHPSDVVAVGDTVEVYIKGLDTEKKKISLGYKKIEDNPWEILKRDYPVGSEITVRIVRMTTFGAFAEIFPKMEGLIHISQISYDRIEKPQDVLSIGDEVKVKVLDIDFDKKRISLSIKALLPPPERRSEDRKPRQEAGPAVYSLDDMIAQANAEAAAAAAKEAAAAEEAAAAVEEAPAAVEEAVETVAEEAAEVAEAAAETVEETVEAAADEAAEVAEAAAETVEETVEAAAEAVEEAPAAVEEAAEAVAEEAAEAVEAVADAADEAPVE